MSTINHAIVGEGAFVQAEDTDRGLNVRFIPYAPGHPNFHDEDIIVEKHVCDGVVTVSVRLRNHRHKRAA